MLYGYMKVSTQDQTDNLQRDVLQSAGMAAAKVRGTHCGRPRAANAETARIIREWHSAGGCVGVSFEDAAHAFLDSRSLFYVDPHPDGDRLRLIGFSEKASAVLFVVHVERTSDADSVVLRIVSARRADRKERELSDKG